MVAEQWSFQKTSQLHWFHGRSWNRLVDLLEANWISGWMPKTTCTDNRGAVRTWSVNLETIENQIYFYFLLRKYAQICIRHLLIAEIRRRRKILLRMLCFIGCYQRGLIIFVGKQPAQFQPAWFFTMLTDDIRFIKCGHGPKSKNILRSCQ